MDDEFKISHIKLNQYQTNVRFSNRPIGFRKAVEVKITIV